MVNRIWMHHFGAPLVRTPSDFGTRCEPPSHPQLLDWLACRFVAEGWSIKKLHRLLMLSAVYGQSSEVTQATGLRVAQPLIWSGPKGDVSSQAGKAAALGTSSEKTLALSPTLSSRGGGSVRNPTGSSLSWAQNRPLMSAAAVDPDNRLLSHFNRLRLDFVAARDSLLAVS